MHEAQSPTAKRRITALAMLAIAGFAAIVVAVPYGGPVGLAGKPAASRLDRGSAFAPYNASSASRTRRSKRWGVASLATNDAAHSTALLAAYTRQYPILTGATVEIGDALGYQAVTFYQTGKIVISPTHAATIDQILAHEIWHVIDWRDNGRIDWGERVPPKGSQ